MGCCSSEETGNLPVMKKRNKVAGNSAYDGKDEDYQDFVEYEIYGHITEKAKEQLELEGEYKPKVPEMDES